VRESSEGSNQGTIGRRGFIDRLLGISVVGLAASSLYPVFRFLSPPKIPESASSRVLAGKVSELAAEPWKIFPFGSDTPRMHGSVS
jgi:hypothetical protein